MSQETKVQLDQRARPLHEALLKSTIEKARRVLLDQQKEDGHWCFELEADCTIPAEYILMNHFVGTLDDALEQKLAAYIRARQNEEGGWPLYYGGSIDLSCTIKAYYALKLVGDSPDTYHMLRARKVILERGGAARGNVFTRITLAMFRQIPWRGVPFIPVEIVLFPRWFPFSISKVSYWSRTVMVPLFILCSMKAQAKNPREVHVKELFVVPPDKERDYHPVRSRLNWIILQAERIAFRLEPFIPQVLRTQALKRAQDWFIERLNGTSGLGAIFPAMVNAYKAMLLLGYEQDDPQVKTAREAIDRLLIVRADEAYCQPCVSPVWDTLLASCALQESGQDEAAVQRALDWLQQRQLLGDTPGDWRSYNPDLPNGSWPFQYENDYYPDLDDTAFAAYCMHRQRDPKYRENIYYAAEWLSGMQSRNGGFAAFDVDNNYFYLNELPFADHGALVDPPTADVSARCLMLFGRLQYDYPQYRDKLQACLQYIFREQETDGSWFGRWGTNYIYGTWSVLIALKEVGIPPEHPAIRRAVAFLKEAQRREGGWGEDNDTYYPELKMRGIGYNSTAVHTAWALLGLMSAGETNSTAVHRGIRFLVQRQSPEGDWFDREFNAPGFPRVFHLKYHGYDKYFPLWALARYNRELKNIS